MAAQRSRARCGMIRRRADVAASKTGCQIAAPTRERRPEPLEATPESRRFQATSVMASCFSNPKEPPYLGVRGCQLVVRLDRRRVIWRSDRKAFYPAGNIRGLLMGVYFPTSACLKRTVLQP